MITHLKNILIVVKSHADAAIHIDHLSIDIAGRIGGQKCGEITDVFGYAVACRGNVLRSNLAGRHRGRLPLRAAS